MQRRPQQNTKLASTITNPDRKVDSTKSSNSLFSQGGGSLASKAFASSVEDSSCSQNDDHCQREDAHSYPQAHPRVRVQVAAGHSPWQHNRRTDTFVITQLTVTRSIKTGKQRPIDVVDVPHSTRWLHLWCNKMPFTWDIHKIHNTNTKCG